MIYFIRAGKDGPIKIGHTARINSKPRITTLRTGHYESLSIVRTFEGTLRTEKWLHAYFQENRLNGEWFKFHTEMLTIKPPKFSPYLKKPQIISMKTAELKRVISFIWPKFGGQTRMAETLMIDGSTVRRYISGVLEIPNPVAVALRALKRVKELEQLIPRTRANGTK